MSQANVRVCEHVDRVRAVGSWEEFCGGEEGDREEGEVKDGEEGAELPVEGWLVLDKVECVMCPKEGSSGTSCWAEFEKDGRVSESSKV